MILKNRNPFVNMRLQKVTVGILCLVLVSLTSCVKQKNCDCGLKGKFVYYENQEEINYNGFKRKANAVFLTTIVTEVGTEEISQRYIVNSVPTKFNSKDTLNVTVCLKEEKRRGGGHDTGVGVVYKLTCIEKED